MAMHNTNSLLKFVAVPVIVLVFLLMILSLFHGNKENHQVNNLKRPIQNSASNDNTAESLDTLTADLSKTKQKILEVAKDNEFLKQKNKQLLNQMSSNENNHQSTWDEQINVIKNQVQNLSEHSGETKKEFSPDQSIAIVDDISKASSSNPLASLLPNSGNKLALKEDLLKKNPIPYYTIPANGTSVHDKLMTALVGRIPVKGVVTDPYPFKIVVSDDNLAANGLRISHLMQMIVSGYCEGDLNLMSVRGWITSLTFVFDDGTISSTTSNDNDIGNFTKANSLGYLSDKYGNPFIRGILITNAPAYLSGSVAINAAVGAANAYSQSQTTNNSSLFGTNSSSVTGSQGKFVAGQARSNAATGVQKWWDDRQEQSFDAIYVAPTDDNENYVQIAVNFAKEIHIDYDPKGRKLTYAHIDDHDAGSTLD